MAAEHPAAGELAAERHAAQVIERVDPRWDAARTERALAGLGRRRGRKRARAAAWSVAIALGAVMLFVASGGEFAGAQPQPIQFADGSTLRPAPGSILVVEEVGEDRIAARLESGSVRADVVPHPERAFVVRSGGITVSVLGTVFEVERIDAERVRVTVERGRVHVAWAAGSAVLSTEESGVFPRSAAPGSDPISQGGSGAASESGGASGSDPMSGAASRSHAVSGSRAASVAASRSDAVAPAGPSGSGPGSAFPANASGSDLGSISRANAASEAGVASGAGTAPQPNGAASAAVSSADSRSRSRSAPSASGPAPLSASEPAARTSPAWRSLAEQGRYDDAYRELRAADVPDRVDDLLLAADAARLSGHAADALPFLDRIVERYADDGRAVLAVFTRGRLRLGLGRPREAAADFERALALEPSGSLAEDALARAALAYASAGDRERARALAARYRDAHPRGRWSERLEALEGAN